MDAPVEGAQLLLAERVVERQHRHLVHHGAEAGARGARDALRGRVGRDERGIGRLERAQLLHQAVVLGVRYQRIIEHVVAVVMLRDLRAQLRCARRRGRRGHDAAVLLRSCSRSSAMRAAVSGLPCSSCSTPCRRSLRLRAVNTSSSNACGGGFGPGSTANSDSPP